MEKFYQDYMEQEWGHPTHGDQELFELLSLECFQAGLSWQTILTKRDAFRQSFADFDIQTVANFDEAKINELAQNPAIIRSVPKIKATVTNAQAVIKIQETQSFDDYVWQWVDYQPIKNSYQSREQVPAQTELSQKFAKDLKQRGFKFVGPVVIYAFMQSGGLVDDRLPKDN